MTVIYGKVTLKQSTVIQRTALSASVQDFLAAWIHATFASSTGHSYSQDHNAIVALEFGDRKCGRSSWNFEVHLLIREPTTNKCHLDSEYNAATNQTGLLIRRLAFLFRQYLAAASYANKKSNKSPCVKSSNFIFSCLTFLRAYLCAIVALVAGDIVSRDWRLFAALFHSLH